MEVAGGSPCRLGDWNYFSEVVMISVPGLVPSRLSFPDIRYLFFKNICRIPHAISANPIAASTIRNQLWVTSLRKPMQIPNSTSAATSLIIFGANVNASTQKAADRKPTVFPPIPGLD